jgi:hypothetical protein
METAKRVMNFLLGKPEHRVLRWIAVRLPASWIPDHLTALGMVGALTGVTGPDCGRASEFPIRGDRAGRRRTATLEPGALVARFPKFRDARHSTQNPATPAASPSNERLTRSCQ